METTLIPFPYFITSQNDSNYHSQAKFLPSSYLKVGIKFTLQISEETSDIQTHISLESGTQIQTWLMETVGNALCGRQRALPFYGIKNCDYRTSLKQIIIIFTLMEAGTGVNKAQKMPEPRGKDRKCCWQFEALYPVLPGQIKPSGIF